MIVDFLFLTRVENQFSNIFYMAKSLIQVCTLKILGKKVELQGSKDGRRCLVLNYLKDY